MMNEEDVPQDMIGAVDGEEMEDEEPILMKDRPQDNMDIMGKMGG